MENQPFDFSEPRRQSTVAIGIILIKFIRMTIRAFWPILLSLFIGGRAGSRFEDIIGFVLLGFAAINLGGSILTFFRFYFHLDKDAIVIDKGVLRRTKTNIPFERIQTINFKQNILHQLFNVVSVEIDTAGAKKSEISIDALKRDEAMALRDFILAEKAQIVPEEIEDQITEEEQITEKEILYLKPLDLIKVGISQNHLRSMALIFAFVFTTLNEITEDIAGLLSDQFAEYEDYVVNNVWFVFVLSTILVLILSFLFSLVNTILKYYELRLSIHKKGLKLVRGLLNREEITINRNKVQIISWSTNPIRKLFNMFTLKISQASSTEASLKSNIKVPGSYQAQINQIIATVFPEDRYQFEITYKMHHLLKIRLFLFLGILPTVLGLATYLGLGTDALYFLLILPVSWILISLYYGKRSYQLNPEFLKSNGGLFGRSHDLTQVHKVQAVRVKQSIYQRRKRIATVLLYTAAGHLTLPFIEIDRARALENFVLYRIQTDSREWM